MYRQTIDVVKGDAIQDGGATHTYELETSGFLSYIDLYAAWTRNASAADIVKGSILDYITAIEVIGNSSEIILSLDGRELAALVYYMQKSPVTERRTEVASASQILHIPIPFGRFLWDPEYALDLSRWDLVELNITYSDPIGTTGFASGTFTVREKFLRDYEGPKGYLKTYEANTWDPPSDVSEKTVDFPKKHPIRLAMISCLLDEPARDAAYAYEMHECLTNVKLTYKSGDIVIFDEGLDELMRENEDMYGHIEMGGTVQGDDGDYFNTDLGYVVDGVLTVEDPATSSSLETVAGLSNFPESRLKINEVNLSAGQACSWKARGFAYMHSAIFHFDPYNTMEHLLDPDEMATVRIKYTTTQDDLKIRTVLQQVKPPE